jgi:toxin CcdB
MAQFDVYPHPIEELRASHPYVIEVQSNFLRRPVALIAIPLARLAPGSEGVAVLNPQLEVAGEALVLETLAIASYEPGELRQAVANLRSDAQAVWDALDYALHGYGAGLKNSSKSGISDANSSPNLRRLTK